MIQLPTFVTFLNKFKGSEKHIVIIFHNSQGRYQFCLIVLYSDGKQKSIYWNPGHLHQVLVGSENNRSSKILIVGGINNDLRSQVSGTANLYAVFGLDPTRISGEAPSYYGESKIGEHLWYAVITSKGNAINRIEIVDVVTDRQKILIWTSNGHVFRLSFDGDIVGRA